MRLEEAQAADEGRAWGVDVVAAAACVFMGKHCPIASWIFCRKVRLLFDPLLSLSLGADGSIPELNGPSPSLALTRSCPGNEVTASNPLQFSFRGQEEDWSLAWRSPNNWLYSNPSLTGLSAAGACEAEPFFFPLLLFRPLPASRLSSDRLCLTLGRAPLSGTSPLFPVLLGKDMMDYAVKQLQHSLWPGELQLLEVCFLFTSCTRHVTAAAHTSWLWKVKNLQNTHKKREF